MTKFIRSDDRYYFAASCGRGVGISDPRTCKVRARPDFDQVVTSITSLRVDAKVYLAIGEGAGVQHAPAELPKREPGSGNAHLDSYAGGLSPHC
jgi:hypothetical protein